MIELISLKFTGLIADHLLTKAYTAKLPLYNSAEMW